MIDRPPDKLCDWPEEPPGSGRRGCGEPVWFVATDAGRAQVVDADGRDHHGTCKAWLARVDRERRERVAAEALRPRLF